MVQRRSLMTSAVPVDLKGALQILPVLVGLRNNRRPGRSTRRIKLGKVVV